MIYILRNRRDVGAGDGRGIRLRSNRAVETYGTPKKRRRRRVTSEARNGGGLEMIKEKGLSRWVEIRIEWRGSSPA